MEGQHVTARRVREMQARARFVLDARNPLRRSCVERAKCRRERDLSHAAEIVRVERAKCRRECDLSGTRAIPRNPQRRSCVLSARNAGESANCPVPAQPSAEIVRVECAKSRRECDLSHARAYL